MKVLYLGELHSVITDTSFPAGGSVCIHPCSAKIRYWYSLAVKISSPFLFRLFNRTPLQLLNHTHRRCISTLHRSSQVIPPPAPFIYPVCTQYYNLMKRKTQLGFSFSKLLSVFQNVYWEGNQHNYCQPKAVQVSVRINYLGLEHTLAFDCDMSALCYQLGIARSGKIPNSEITAGYISNPSHLFTSFLKIKHDILTLSKRHREFLTSLLDITLFRTGNWRLTLFPNQ